MKNLIFNFKEGDKMTNIRKKPLNSLEDTIRAVPGLKKLVKKVDLYKKRTSNPTYRNKTRDRLVRNNGERTNNH